MGKGKRIKEQRKKAEENNPVTPEILSKGISTGRYYNLTTTALLLLAISSIIFVLFTKNVIYYEPYFYADFFDSCAAPLLAFTLVESFYHSDNHKRKLLTLLIMGAICEPFKDIVTFEGNIWMKQNIFFSLLISYITLGLIHKNWTERFASKLYKKPALVKIFGKVFTVAGVIFLITASSYCKLEYGFRFILLVLLFDFARHRKHTKIFQFIAVILYIISYGKWTYMNVSCVLALLAIYDAEKKTRKSKGAQKKDRKIEEFYTRRPVKKFSMIVYPLGLLIASIIKVIIYFV